MVLQCFSQVSSGSGFAFSAFPLSTMVECHMPNGPIAWNHPCAMRALRPPVLLASFGERQGEHAPQASTLTTPVTAWTPEWTVKLAFFITTVLLLLALLVILMLVRERQSLKEINLMLVRERVRERQSQKEINQKKVRRTWRLAATAKLWEVAYDSICEEKMKASCKQFDRDEALECGETFFFGSEGLEAPLHELADASFETMKRRMELDQAPEWSWQANHAWFAVRSWGAIVWKWVMQTLAASCCELLSIGSCGAGAGQALLDRMLATIAAQHEGVIYVILKSRAAAESFWEGQAFTSLTSIFSDATPPQWFVNCPGCVQRILKRYREESGLKTFVRLVQGKRRHSVSSSTSSGSTASAPSISSMV